MSGRPSILVVDDDRVMREMLVEFLELAGFEACSAAGVEEALSRLGEHPYAAVVSDVQMGPRTGYELLREILSQSKSTRVILMSSFGGAAASRIASEAGAYAYLTKPFDPDELIGLLRSVATHAPF
jgi:two-component system C4-dicarboxylate transport response regulator DctD